MNCLKHIIQKQYFTIYYFRIPVNFLKMFRHFLMYIQWLPVLVRIVRHFCLLFKKPEVVCFAALWDIPPGLKSKKSAFSLIFSQKATITNKLRIMFSFIHSNDIFFHRNQGGVSQSAAKHTTLTVFNHKNYCNYKLSKILIQCQLFN